MPDEGNGHSPEHKKGIVAQLKKHWIMAAFGVFAVIFVWFMMRKQSKSPQSQAYDPTAGQGSAGGGTSGGGAPDFSAITDAITAAQQQEQQDLEAVMAGQSQNQQDLLAAMEADRAASDQAQQGYFAQLAAQLGSIFQGAQAAASYPTGGSANPQTELRNASSALAGAVQSLLPGQSSPTVFGGTNIDPVTGAYVNPSGPTPFFPGAVLNQPLAQQVGALVTNTGTYYGTPSSQAAQTTYQQLTQSTPVPTSGSFAGVSAPSPSSILKALGGNLGLQPGQQIKPY